MRIHVLYSVPDCAGNTVVYFIPRYPTLIKHINADSGQGQAIGCKARIRGRVSRWGDDVQLPASEAPARLLGT
jgi:hypothetical protein